jgi:hypothetical protein
MIWIFCYRCIARSHYCVTEVQLAGSLGATHFSFPRGPCAQMSSAMTLEREGKSFLPHTATDEEDGWSSKLLRAEDSPDRAFFDLVYERMISIPASRNRIPIPNAFMARNSIALIFNFSILLLENP